MNAWRFSQGEIPAERRIREELPGSALGRGMRAESVRNLGMKQKFEDAEMQDRERRGRLVGQPGRACLRETEIR